MAKIVRYPAFSAPTEEEMGFPELPEEFQRPPGQRHVSVLVPLAADVEKHAVSVDIGNLQGPALRQSQAAGVNRGQTDAMAEHVDACKGASDLIEAQDAGQGFDALGFDKTDGGPVLLQGIFVEELDSTEGNGAGHAGPAADIGAEKEILSQFLIRNQVRGLMIVFSQFTNRSGVGFLGPRGEAP